MLAQATRKSATMAARPHGHAQQWRPALTDRPPLSQLIQLIIILEESRQQDRYKTFNGELYKKLQKGRVLSIVSAHNKNLTFVYLRLSITLIEVYKKVT